MLARAESRQREFAIRSALGAGRWRLLRQFLTEGIVLALVGGGLGAALGFGGLRALVAANPESLPRSGEIALDPRVLVFTLVVSLLTGVIFGLSPLLHLRERIVNSSLKESGQRSTASAGRTWVRADARDVRSGAGRRARHWRRPAVAQFLEPDAGRRRFQPQPPRHVRARAAKRPVSESPVGGRLLRARAGEACRAAGRAERGGHAGPAAATSGQRQRHRLRELHGAARRAVRECRLLPERHPNVSVDARHPPHRGP